MAGAWLMTVTGGTGTIGSMPLASSSFSGTVVRTTAGVRGTVSVGLPLLTAVVPSWSKAARVRLTRNNGPWAGVVTAQQGGGARKISMRGALRADTGFTLTVTGCVSFAGTTVPLGGWYASAPSPAGAARWSISGEGRSGSFDGASVRAPSVRMTHRAPGVTGLARVRLTEPRQLEFVAAVRVSGTSRWELIADGSSLAQWMPQVMPGLVVRTADLSGSIVGSSSGVAWQLTAPMTLTASRLTLQGSLDFRGPQSWRLRPERGSGTILDEAERYQFTGTGAMTIDQGVASGYLGLRRDGDLLLHMPDGWTASTAYRLTPSLGKDGRVAFGHSVTVEHSDMGGSVFSLLGPVSASGAPYSLAASGHLMMSGARVLIRGSFHSAGSVVDSVVLNAPRLDAGADIADAQPFGFVSLDGGGRLVSGRLDFVTEEAAPAAATSGGFASLSTTMPSTSMSGTTEVQISSNSPYAVTSKYAYTNSSNWQLTAAGDSTNPWQPFTGFSVPENVFAGTITTSNDVQAWSMTIPNITWTDIASGASMSKATYTMSNVCSVPSRAECPVVDGQQVYVSTSGATITFIDGTSSMTGVSGSFLASSGWALFKGPMASMTYNHMPMSNLTGRIYHGPQSSDIDPGIVMPDLSGGRMNTEFCGTFQISVPQVVSESGNGCVTWSTVGFVMAQSYPKGNYTTDPTNNVNTQGGSISGYAFTNIQRTAPIEVTLNSTTLTIEPSKNYITSDVVVPGGLLHDIGTGKGADGTYVATGWFTTSPEVSMTLSIPVGLDNGTVSLDAVTVGIDLAKGRYVATFGVKGTAKVDGRRYPVTATLSASSLGGTVTVAIDVRGGRTDAPVGGFDTTNLLPSGGFEPSNASAVSSTFDGDMPKDGLIDGGFENGTEKSSEVQNPGFEDDVQPNLVADPGFEGNSGQQLLENADAEDLELLANPDFESYKDASGKGTMAGWTTDGGVSTYVSADGSNDPSNSTAVWVKNTSSTVTSGVGLRQATSQLETLSLTYRLTFTVRSDGGSGTVEATIGHATSSTCSFAGAYPKKFSLGANDGWKQFTYDYKGGSCAGKMYVVLAPATGNWTFVADSVSMKVVSPVSSAKVSIGSPTVNTPSLVARYDSEFVSGYRSSNVTLSPKFGGSILSQGCNEYLYQNWAGSANGDFESSMDLFFPSNSSSNAQDSANFAWGMSGTDAKATGWAFRVNSRADSNQGFFQIKGSGVKTILDASFQPAPVSTDTWYTVHVLSVGRQLTGWLSKKSDNSTVFWQAYTIPSSMSYSPSGQTGQAVDGNCNPAGHYWDNFSTRSAASPPVATINPAGAHANGATNNGYISITGPGPDGQNIKFGAQYQVMTGDIVAGSTYTYEAWLYSAKGNANGTLILETIDADPDNSEAVRVPIAMSQKWQKFSVTLPIIRGGHIGVRPGIVDVDGLLSGSTTVHHVIYMDDQSLVELDWGYPAGSSVALGTSSSARSGSVSMAVTDNNGAGTGSEVRYQLGTPYANAKYTLSMWVASDSSSDFSGTIGLAGGGTPEARSGFTVPGRDGAGNLQWRELVLEYDPSAESSGMYISIKTGSGNKGRTLLVDDVSVLATGVDDHIEGRAGTVPLPSQWSTDRGRPFVINDQPNARSGLGFMRVGAANGTVSSSFTFTGAMTSGQAFTLSAWIRTPDSGSGTSSVSLAQDSGSCASGSTPTTSDIALSSSWQEVTLTCVISSNSVKSLTLTMGTSTSGMRLDVDDVQLQTQGMNLADAWAVAPTSSTGLATVSAVKDPSGAHAGDFYLSMRGTGGGLRISDDASFDGTSYTTNSMAAWLRSADGSAVKVRLTLIGYDSLGNQVGDARNSDLTVSGSSWIRAFTSQSWTGAVTKVRTQIQVADSDKTVFVDDVDTRAVESWGPLAPGGTDSVLNQLDDDAKAASGNGYMNLRTAGAPTSASRVGIVRSSAQTVNKGTSYDLQAYVRAPAGSKVTGRIGVTYGAGTSAAETLFQPFTAGDGWLLVSASFMAAADHGTGTTQLFVSTDAGGLLDVDEVMMTPRTVSPDPSWVSYYDQGGSITWADYDDKPNAHDGSAGVLKMTKSSTTGRGGVVNSQTIATVAGDTYTFNGWVRTASGTSANGSFELCFDGGPSEECASTPFSTPSDGSWKLLTVVLRATMSHTDMHVATLITNSAESLFLDDASLQRLDWVTGSADGSTAFQKVINDSASAQAGSGYLQLTNTGSGSAWTTGPTSRSYSQGSVEYLSVWVRGSGSTSVNGTLYIGPSGGPYQTKDFSVGPAWTELTMTYEVYAATVELDTRVRLTTANASIDIDTMTLSDSNVAPNGVTAPLDHPESGYYYLWDNAFGIPGAHLWGMTAQVQFNVEGVAGLGVGATMYMDPTKLPEVMTGTAWVKGDMTVNVSAVDPCFSVKFDGGNTGSRLSINSGVLSASLFYLNWAPKGCTVGTRAVPRGTSFGFTAALGDGQVSMALMVGYDDKGQRMFHGEVGVTELNIGGTRYETLELTVDHSAGKSSTFFEALMRAPFGTFFGKISLSVAKGGKLALVGRIALTDWHLVGGGFTIENLSLDVNDQVPFAPSTNCGFIHDDIDGNLSMAKKTSLVFSGVYESVCGEMTVLHLQYAYTHGGLERDFMLDYSAATGILSGSTSFEFNRSFSWKFLSHRYHRHPKVFLSLTWSMDVGDPGKAGEAVLDGLVDVAGGSGSLACKLSSSGDDYCRIKVDIDRGIGGGRHWEEDW